MPPGDHLHQPLGAHRALGEGVEAGLDGHHGHEEERIDTHAATGLLGRRQERLEGHRRHLVALGHIGLHALQVGAQLDRRLGGLGHRLDGGFVIDHGADGRLRRTETTQGQTLNAVIGNARGNEQGDDEPGDEKPAVGEVKHE